LRDAAYEAIYAYILLFIGESAANKIDKEGLQPISGKLDDDANDEFVDGFLYPYVV